MTIRTVDEFIGKVDAQLIWRRKELTGLRGMVQSSATNPTQKAILLRAGVSLLYAHWEGFIKTSGTYFLQFVAGQRLTPAQLSPNFVGIIVRSKLAIASDSKKVSSTERIISFFETERNSRIALPVKNIIDTDSNLSSTVMCEINWILGLDNAPYALKKTIIDGQLVGRRNCIAHGESVTIEIDEYLVLHDNVMGLLDEFRNQIQNACVLRRFIRT